MAGARRPSVGAFQCVGGASVFYAGVSLRFRAQDFEPDLGIVGDSNARWPFTYDDLEPYYCRAEELLGVSGSDEGDPTAPFRSAPFPQLPSELSDTARMIEAAAHSLQLKPFRLPLAINYQPSGEQSSCISRAACDGFACAIGAKNDLAVKVLPGLIRRGLVLKPKTAAIRLIHQDGRIVAVQCVETATGQTVRYSGRRFVLSTGSLASPHLLLASGLQAFNPAGHAIGHYLTRHCKRAVMGWFARDPNPTRRFHKQIGIHDFYLGHPTFKHPVGRLGAIQSIAPPPAAVIRAHLPKLLGPLVDRYVQHLTGLLVIAEDQPQFENQVSIDPTTSDRWGMPQPVITYHHSSRDLAAGRALAQKAAQILRRAGAAFCYTFPVDTFVHALGTVRMGVDPRTSPLDPYCQFRGIGNLYVVDGSCFPTSAGVNPSLTIAANALRVADHMTARR